MAIRDIYLKIESIEDYSPVRPMEKTAPPIFYGRDCARGMGHPDGVIPEAEIEARALTALVYRQYRDSDFLIPVVDKIVAADINEPIWSRRIPGTVIYANPGETLRITVFNADSEPHSFHLHGLDYGIDSDGAWPFGTQATDGRRSDEICPGTSWTYTFDVPASALGAWPFHSHWRNVEMTVNEGLFGGLIVLPRRRRPPYVLDLPKRFEDLAERIRERLPRKWPPPPPPPDPWRHAPMPPHYLPGDLRPFPDRAMRLRGGPQVVRRAHHAGPASHHGMPFSPGPLPHTGETPHHESSSHHDGMPPPEPVLPPVEQYFDLIDEFVLNEIVRPLPMPRRPPTLHVPIFYHVLADHHATPLFDSGDIEELTGIFELVFAEAGSFDYFCRYHPMMQGTVDVVPGGPATVTVTIVDNLPGGMGMGFTPDSVTVGIGGTVRWENHSQQHHTVTSREGSSMATHCFNGRGFVGNSPTIVARSGQKIRWYIFNLDLSMDWHNFHTHAQRWTFAGENVDVRSIGPAESFIVDTVAPTVLLLTDAMKAIQEPAKRPKGAKRYELAGDFVFHCHVHHHMMNGMVGVVRSKQTVWLTDDMVEELEATRGLPIDSGTNACPQVDLDHCAKMAAGRWETVPGDPEVTLMHSMLVPQTDKVLYWGYTRADQSRLWDGASGTYAPPANQPADVTPGPSPATESDLWSAEHEYLDTADGAILAHGGFTPDKSYVFDAGTESWSRVQDTADDRFYSSTFSLDDGRVITMFGSFSKSFEIYEQGVGWTPPIPVPVEFNIFQYYPWSYLLPDGRVFIAGNENPTRRFDPLAPVADPAETFAMVHGANRSLFSQAGTAVLLVLRPPGYAARVVIAGGNNPAALSSAEIIDLSSPAPAWSALPDMHEARDNLTGVLLPTGEVFVAGGLTAGADGGPAEILDLEGGLPTWRLGPPMAYRRGYHSSMLLLRDGSVLAGGDPDREPDGSPTPHERYFPWYYDLPRPSIASAPGQVSYGSGFTIDTPAAGDIAEVVLLRPGAVTHSFNMTQRGVELVMTGMAATSVDVDSPPNARLAPPGWYLLFVLDGGRVPSEGRWIRLTP
ncbi:MAG: galactose oxidase-like domain-containing protein [Gemmatimonadota bacterium]